MSLTKNFLKFFIDILHHHAPLKQKQIRRNHAPFMTKDLNKAIMNKSKAKNKYLRARANFVSYKRIKKSVIL